MSIAVIGGGLCGLTAAIRLAQGGADVELFEAAPAFGGRTRSYFDERMQQWVDNGPHLLSGAYHATQALLAEAGAADTIAWQTSLNLPLWDHARGHFMLHPKPYLPLALALPLACARLPGHGMRDIAAFLRLAGLLGRTPDANINVQAWLAEARLPDALISDMLEPLCLGAMNEDLPSANAASFRTVLNDAFADHASARLGWFRAPLSQSVIAPLLRLAEGLGVRLHSGARIRGIRRISNGIQICTKDKDRTFAAAILALPLRAGQQLLGHTPTANTSRISNIHLWFRQMPALPHPFIGGLGTCGQWFFDISSQMPGSPACDPDLRHICAVISADHAVLSREELEQAICTELTRLSGSRTALQAVYVRIISEHHATTGVGGDTSQPRLSAELPSGLIDACEAPRPGELPATIESAVRRGNTAAEQCILQLTD